MLMPTKIIKPVDSLFSISAYVLKVLYGQNLNIDNLHDDMHPESLDQAVPYEWN